MLRALTTCALLMMVSAGCQPGARNYATDAGSGNEAERPACSWPGHCRPYWECDQAGGVVDYEFFCDGLDQCCFPGAAEEPEEEPEPDTGSDTGEFSCDAPPYEEIDPGGYGVPAGCVALAKGSEVRWEGRPGLHGSQLAWADYIPECEAMVLRVRDLESGEVTDAFYVEHYVRRLITRDGTLYFDARTDSSSGSSRELFRLAPGAEEPEQLTDDDVMVSAIAAGGGRLVYTSYSTEDEGWELRWLDLDSLESTLITDDGPGPTWIGRPDYDGERYVTWGIQTSPTVAAVFVADLEEPGEPAAVSPTATSQWYPIVEDGRLLVAQTEEDETDGFDLWSYELETEIPEWINPGPGDQVGAAADGALLAYLDTEDLSEPYSLYGGQAHITLTDRETSVKRRLTVVADGFRDLALSGRNLAFAVGGSYAKLVVCDLEAIGFVDAAGHLCPEPGCFEPDGGVDGGLGD